MKTLSTLLMFILVFCITAAAITYLPPKTLAGSFAVTIVFGFGYLLYRLATQED